MSDPQAHLNDIAARIADGTPVDWMDLSGGSDESGGRVVENLRIVAQIAALHASSSLITSLTSGSLHAVDGARHSVPLPAGSMWGHLKILECLGRGRFGVVYRAFDATLERQVALKLVKNRQTGADIAHEGRMMARVHHPNVVTVFGAQTIEDEVGIWMQLVRGQTLEAELQTDGPFAADEIIRVGVDLCEALAAVHAVGLVHRDVKAANVMRDVNGRVVLGDFGTGQLIDDARSGLAGTPLYLAPEVIAGAPATPQSDVYSLGVTLFRLATAGYPVNGRSIRELRDAHGSADRRSLATSRPDFPRSLVDAIEGAITTDATVRWASAKKFQRMLDAGRATGSSRPRRLADAVTAISLKTAAFLITSAIATILLVSLPMTDGATSAGSPAGAGSTITTRSTRALRLYTVAASMMQGRAPWPEAEAQRFLREALVYDPQFASARILLAHSLNNQDHPFEEVLAEAGLAMKAAGMSSEGERSFIEGSFYHFRGYAAEDPAQRRRDFESAANAYERLLRLVPNHVWGYYNLTQVYGFLRRDADVLRVWVLDAQNHPDSAVPLAWVAAEHYRVGAFDKADPFINRARELMQNRADTDIPAPSMWVLFAPAHRSWMADSAAEALRRVDAVAPPDSDARVITMFARQKVALYLALGRLDDAERASSIAPAATEQDDLLLSVLVYRNDRERINELLLTRYTTTADLARVLLLPLPSDIVAPHLRRLAADMPVRLRKARVDMFVAGRLALAEGRLDEGISLLEAYEPFIEERGMAARMLMALAVAEARTSKGDTAPAIARLESATRLRSAATFAASTGALWIQTRSRLAELYRQTGRVRDAERIEQHLRKILAVADDDHPLKSRLVDLTVRQRGSSIRSDALYSR